MVTASALNGFTHCALVSLAVRLHPPVEFTETVVGDTPMMTATMGDPAEPYFVPVDAFIQLVQFVEEVPPQVAAIVGPVRCGKSTVLHSVLPALVANDHRTRGTPPPLILDCSFNNFGDPDYAAQKLVAVLSMRASAVGVHVEDPSPALLGLDTCMGDVALAVSDKGYRLWLLLDECQVRL